MQTETTPTAVLKLTSQEQKIINYCSGRGVVSWEELAQFAKDPASVKLKTIQKVISDIKKKYRDMNLPHPIQCQFKLEIERNPPSPNPEVTMQVTNCELPSEPKLVQLRITRGGNRVPMSNTQSDCHIDFKLEPFYKRVRTRLNVINLSDNEWELFTLLHANPEKMFSMEDLKNVVYKNFGSKTPHNWADAIKRTLTKLRTNIRELKVDNRLVTVMGGNTTYYMLK